MNTATKGPQRLLQAAQRLETLRRNTTKGERIATGSTVMWRTSFLSPWSTFVEFLNGDAKKTREADAAMMALHSDGYVQATIRMLRTSAEDTHWDAADHQGPCGSCDRLAAAVAVADHLALGEH